MSMTKVDSKYLKTKLACDCNDPIIEVTGMRTKVAYRCDTCNHSWTAEDVQGYFKEEEEEEKEVWFVQPGFSKCGGNFGWCKVKPSGAFEPIGCVCHFNPPKGAKIISTEEYERISSRRFKDA